MVPLRKRWAFPSKENSSGLLGDHRLSRARRSACSNLVQVKEVSLRRGAVSRAATKTVPLARCTHSRLSLGPVAVYT